MAKFKKGDKVRVKDNPTRYDGRPSPLNPGDIVVVRDGEPDEEGDICVDTDLRYYNREYVNVDCVELVETDPQDVHVGDKIRAYCKYSETAREGVVTRIDDIGYVWIGKSADIAYNQNYLDRYEVTVLERAFKWPDHEGFVRITGGPRAGERAIAYTYFEPSDIALRVTDGTFIPSDDALAHDPDFDFEYVEG